MTRSDYTPNWMPVYPANSVQGRKRTAPVAWVCPEGHKHTSKVCSLGN